ncbi:helix-turn-helix transcriptional regulator [Thalassotalea maritima]|uniref:helix-turn-helix transcriptional regulator n=1 Tax=Thalassotalea maritima TaxID=3242416 RepID=UPI003527B8DD
MSQLLATPFEVEQQFIALGTFATCNVFWLLTRCMFRKGRALANAHYILAGVIAVLILLVRSIDIAISLQWIEQQTFDLLKRSLSELLKILTSGVLLLAFWEVIRGYGASSKRIRQQKFMIAGTMLVAVMSTRVIFPSLPLDPELMTTLYPGVRSVAASAMLTVIIIVLWLQHQYRVVNRQTQKFISEKGRNDEQLLNLIESLMTEKALYLQPELKLMDVANALNEPEYKISKEIKDRTDFKNFNHFINHLRLEHAKRLLTVEPSKDWTILVVSLESGFSSLATFNRVFKQLEGCTPKQYRQLHTI